MYEMNAVAVQTSSTRFVKIRQTNSTDPSFPSRVPRIGFAGVDNQPSGKGDAAAQTTFAVFDLVGAEDLPPGTDRPNVQARQAQNRVILVFFGTSAADQTFKARLIGWRYCTDRNADMVKTTSLWIPVTLAEFTVTLGTSPGLAGAIVDNTNFFADTIALSGTSGNDDISIDIVSPADNTIAHVVADLKGFQKYEVTFDRNSSAASANGLVALY